MRKILEVGKIKFKEDILKFVEERGSVKCKTVSDQFKISWNTAYRYLSELALDGKLMAVNLPSGFFFKKRKDKENLNYNKSQKTETKYKKCICKFEIKCPVCLKVRKVLRNVKTHENLDSFLQHLTREHKDLSDNNREEIKEICENIRKALHYGMIGKESQLLMNKQDMNGNLSACNTFRKVK